MADRLHSAALHLLRRLRTEDDALGVSPPRLSALSVVVFAGPIGIGALAAAEGVTAPTMSRLVDGLERDGYVTRAPDPGRRPRRAGAGDGGGHEDPSQGTSAARRGARGRAGPALRR